MISALTVLHVIVCIFLIAVVLLQRGKGAEMGAVFGGGASSTVFGSAGAGNFLTLLTKICAAVFMLTSLSLSYLYTEETGDRLFESEIEASEADPFEQMGTVLPDEMETESAVVDFVDVGDEEAALEETLEAEADPAENAP
jgi:preprotein translocase subunit SecG